MQRQMVKGVSGVSVQPVKELNMVRITKSLRHILKVRVKSTLCGRPGITLTILFNKSINTCLESSHVVKVVNQIDVVTVISIIYEPRNVKTTRVVEDEAHVFSYEYLMTSKCFKTPASFEEIMNVYA